MESLFGGLLNLKEFLWSELGNKKPVRASKTCFFEKNNIILIFKLSFQMG